MFAGMVGLAVGGGLPAATPLVLGGPGFALVLGLVVVMAAGVLLLGSDRKVRGRTAPLGRGGGRRGGASRTAPLGGVLAARRIGPG